MKKLYLLIFILCTSLAINATEHLVKVRDFAFSPILVMAAQGDTVTWVWESGIHTTTSVGIPAGAASWNAPISSNNLTYSYVVKEAGDYSYKCTPHGSMGMAGAISVVGTTTGINSINGAETLKFKTDWLNKTIEISNKELSQVEIISIEGKICISKKFTDKDPVKVNYSDLSQGVYIIRATGRKEEYTLKTFLQ